MRMQFQEFVQKQSYPCGKHQFLENYAYLQEQQLGMRNEKLSAQENDIEKSDMEMPEIKDYKLSSQMTREKSIENAI